MGRMTATYVAERQRYWREVRNRAYPATVRSGKEAGNGAAAGVGVGKIVAAATLGGDVNMVTQGGYQVM